MSFQQFKWAAMLAATVLSCSMSWAQHEHAQPNVSEAVVVAPAVASTPKPAARKPRPQLGIGAAYAPDGTLWLAGLNAEGQLFVQTAAPAGAASPQWSAPRVLDTAGDPISADGENHPKLVFGPHATVLIAYTRPVLGKHHAGHVRLLRSVDAGQTFAAPITLHADRQDITHRFEMLGFDAQGLLHTVWIDSRDEEAAPKVGKKSSYTGAAVYRNISLDDGASFGPDLKLADHTCECCRIALGLGSDGVLRTLWRHIFTPNVRDHAFAALTPASMTVAVTPIVRATFDDWRVDACPHHGPGLAPAGDGFHTVWFGIRQQGDDKGAAVRYAQLNADGSPRLKTVRRLPDERAEHADVMADGLRVAVVWRSIDGMTSTLKAWLSTDGGQTFRVQTLGQVSGENDFPRLVQLGSRMAVVWRNAKEVQVYDIQF